VMVQGWYQGGISVFDFTDARNPVEIAFFDRGPVNAQQMASGGSWSVYWYNGLIVNSEISRGLDILELTPSGFISQCEIDAARSVRMDYFNAQMQPRFEWPASFALSCAYLDQLERSRGLDAADVAEAREDLADAQAAASAAERRSDLLQLVDELEEEVARSSDRRKGELFLQSLRDLAAAQR